MIPPIFALPNTVCPGPNFSDILIYLTVFNGHNFYQLGLKGFSFLLPFIETYSLFKNGQQNTQKKPQNIQCLQNNLKVQLCFAQLVNLLRN